LKWAENSPDMVNLWIPLLKEGIISYTEIKECTRAELLGLAAGLNNYNVMHAFDGYSEKDISEMAKNNPSVRGDYARTQAMKAKYGEKKAPTNFRELLN
jgi:hypothetical protein|tara:strand:+ start:6486 stop:6782 length:297 start_codon:yes stop_codon:yes gene_type:complete